MPQPDEPRKPEYHEYDSRLGAYVLLLRDGADGEEELLLALWNQRETRLWTLPGGGVELDETPAEGAIREVWEESGYEVELTGLLAVDTLVIDSRDRQPGIDRQLRAIRVLYSGRIVGGKLTPEIGGSTDESRWFPVSGIPELPRVGLVDVALRVLGERPASSA
jgi:8-oxo-dGTP diphosphatase